MCFLTCHPPNYVLFIRRRDGTFEELVYTLKNREATVERMRSILRELDSNMLSSYMEGLHSLRKAAKTILDNIYSPIKYRLVEYGDRLPTDPFCHCEPNTNGLKYCFGPHVDDKHQFRTVVDVNFPDGCSTRRIDVDVRYGNKSNYRTIVDEILQKHEQCKMRKCSGVLGRDEITTCVFYVADIAKLITEFEDSLSMKS